MEDMGKMKRDLSQGDDGDFANFFWESKEKNAERRKRKEASKKKESNEDFEDIDKPKGKYSKDDVEIVKQAHALIKKAQVMLDSVFGEKN